MLSKNLNSIWYQYCFYATFEYTNLLFSSKWYQNEEH